MNDPENKKKDSSTFQDEPFSVDVWERAYKNVGRPFDKDPFDSLSAYKDSSTDALPTKVVTPQKTIGKAPEQKKKELEGYRAAERNRASVSKSTPTVTPPSYSSPSPQRQAYTPQKSYTNTWGTSPKQDEDNAPTNFFQMIESAFSKDISDSFNNIGDLIKNSFGDSKKKKQKSINPFLAFILFIIFLIFGILANL